MRFVKNMMPTCAVALGFVLVPSLSVCQDSADGQEDSLNSGRLTAGDRREALLGEDASVVEAVSWEMQAIPPSLTASPSNVLHAPSQGPQYDASSTRGVRTIRTSGDGQEHFPGDYQTRGRKSVYCETTFRQNFGQTSAPPDSLLLGNPFSSVFRLKVEPHPDWSAHFVLAKQSGERYKDASLYGSLRYGNETIEQLIVGDYRFRAGFGLVLSGNQTSFGEGTVRTHSKAGSLVPYFGTGPVGFFRGAAASLKQRLLGGTARLTALVSKRSLAATVQADGSVSAIDWSGYQRTEKELGKQGNLLELLIGLRASWTLPGSVTVGSTWYRSNYDRSILPKSGRGFRGKRSEVGGLDASVRLGQVNLFGEIARGNRGLCSMLAGAEASPAEQLSFVILLRSYAAGFSNPHASCFGRHGDGGNERGAYLGFSTSPLPGIEFNGSVDIYRIPGPTATNPLPTSGQQSGFRTVLRMHNGIVTTIRLRFSRSSELRIVEIEGAGPARKEIGRDRLTVDGVVQLPRSGRLDLKCRLTAVSVRPGYGLASSHGYSIAVSGEYKTRSFQAECSTGLFSAESYEAAVVEIEPDLGRSASAVVCYGSGVRSSLWLSCEPWEWMRVSGKLGVTLTKWRPSHDRPIEGFPPQTSLGVNLVGTF
ncbi:MAG: hypothetical protein WB699_09685 [Bacteroidota bacterium]